VKGETLGDILGSSWGMVSRLVVEKNETASS
jgi:hypothetical protein